MGTATLHRHLDPLLGGKLDALYTEYSATHEPDDARFIAWLRDGGQLTGEQVRDLVCSLEVRIDEPTATEPRHDLLGLLGKGAMGQVHLARDRMLGRAVAVKRMDPDLARNQELARRFRAEVRITAQLEHPGIVPVYGLEITPDGATTYTMKLVRGHTLQELLDEARRQWTKTGKVDAEHALPELLSVYLAVCDAIAYAHTRGVVHRDLKPENIMVGAFHEVIVMDWGIARVLGVPELVGEAEVSTGKAERTQLGLVIGTPCYMSPEQAEGRNDQVDGRSDQYTLGLILYEILSLRRAITGKTGVHVLTRAAEAEKVVLKALDPRMPMPPALKAIISKATQAEPERRYRDVTALALDVRRFLRDEPISARPDTLAQRAQRWVGRHRGGMLAGAAMLVIALLLTVATATIGGLGLYLSDQQKAEKHERRVAEIRSVTADQARRIDARMRSYESLLTGLAFAAEQSLRRDPETPEALYFTGPFTEPGGGPPDLALSDRYKANISARWPDVTLAPGVDAAALTPDLQRLVAMRGEMFRAMLLSHGDVAFSLDEAAQDKLITGRGVPIVWASLALERGALVAMPGIGVYPKAYDPRTMAWYQGGKGKRYPTWSPTYVDESGMGRAARGRGGHRHHDRADDRHPARSARPRRQGRGLARRRRRHGGGAVERQRSSAHGHDARPEAVPAPARDRGVPLRRTQRQRDLRRRHAREGGRLLEPARCGRLDVRDHRHQEGADVDGAMIV